MLYVAEKSWVEAYWYEESGGGVPARHENGLRMGWDENEMTEAVVGSGVLFKAKGVVFIM